MFFMGLILRITIFASMAVPRKTRWLLFVGSRTQKLCLQALQLNDIRQFGWQILKVKSEIWYDTFCFLGNGRRKQKVSFQNHYSLCPGVGDIAGSWSVPWQPSHWEHSDQVQLLSPKQLLRDGSAVLSCPTGFLLGVQSRHRTQALGLKGITSIASLDAYCFGHILYEVGSCWKTINSCPTRWLLASHFSLLLWMPCHQGVQT